MSKISLSYSTMNALINEPHTYLNKISGLKTVSNRYMDEGKAAHRIIQDHVSGKIMHPFLMTKELPRFEIVEHEDFDPATKVNFDINDKYFFNGFVDGKDPASKAILEIKTGTPWSVGKFDRLVQWKLYMLGMPEYTKIYLVNTPRLPEQWSATNVIVMSAERTPQYLQEAQDFITKAIDVIEHLQDQKLHVEGRSKWCYYPACSFCSEPLPAYG